MDASASAGRMANPPLEPEFCAATGAVELVPGCALAAGCWLGAGAELGGGGGGGTTWPITLTAPLSARATPGLSTRSFWEMTSGSGLSGASDTCTCWFSSIAVSPLTPNELASPERPCADVVIETWAVLVLAPPRRLNATCASPSRPVAAAVPLLAAAKPLFEMSASNCTSTSLFELLLPTSRRACCSI